MPNMASGIAALFVAGMLASQPFGALSQPAHDRAAIADAHNDGADNGDSAANPLLPPVVLAPIQIQTNALQRAADEQTRNHDNDGVKWTDRAIAGLTLVLALCGVAGVVVAIFQWNALKAQVEKLKEAIAAEIQSGVDRAEENAKALAAAQRANEIAGENFNRQHRPWITIEDITVGRIDLDQAGLPRISFFITYRNVGLTPASNVFVNANVRVLTSAGLDLGRSLLEHMRATERFPRTLAWPTLLPNDQIRRQQWFANMTPEEFARIENGRMAPIIFGSIQYFTQTDERPRQTSFRLHIGIVAGTDRSIVVSQIPIPQDKVGITRNAEAGAWQQVVT